MVTNYNLFGMFGKSYLGSILIFMLIGSVAIAQDSTAWKMQPVSIQTRWAKNVNPEHPIPEYPRPQMVRARWTNLNGLWDYAISGKDLGKPTKFDGKILVPYPIESSLSGVMKPLRRGEYLWYRKIIFGYRKTGERVLLHFGAVDWKATVFINGIEKGIHTGGYQAFVIDITDELSERENEILVKVYDPTNEGIAPHGKQVLNPANIYYTSTSGIWQTVWLEMVPAMHISGIKMTTDIDQGFLNVEVSGPKGAAVEIIALDNNRIVSRITGKVGNLLKMKMKNAKLWSPSNPFLYDLKVTLLNKGKIVDEVKSYFGMRKISVQKDSVGVDRIFLNGVQYFNLGILDQGFWPEGLYTAPTDSALLFDIMAIKAMGFNTVRKHIKIEPARWYYHADKVGLLVWQDFVNPNQSLPAGSKEQFEKETLETVNQLYNFPCITTWVIFNEKWGAYDQQRITNWIKRLDGSRIVNGHSGEKLYVKGKLRSPSPNAWVGSDLTDVHSYPDPMDAPLMPGKARVLGEFGGIGVFVPDHQWNPENAWGYINEKPSTLLTKYRILNQHLYTLKKQGLSGSIYTQPFDVEGEQNGLITYDREVIKLPIKTLREIHSRLTSDTSNLPLISFKEADLNDPSIEYSRKIDRYIDGNREKEFLRELYQLSIRNGDLRGQKNFSNEYISTLKAPFKPAEVEFVLNSTTSIDDVGFRLLEDHAGQFDLIIGKSKVSNKVKNILYYNLIEPAISGPDTTIQWAQLKNQLSSYGVLGEEIYLKSKAIYFLNKKDWPDFAESVDDWISSYGDKINNWNLNIYAWNIFENISDKKLLEKALQWSSKTLADSNHLYFDTYANLLYKLGKKDQAIKYEQKAIEISENEERKSYQQVLRKMKESRPTWVN